MGRTSRGLNREFKVKFNPTFFESLETFASQTGEDVSEVIRKAVEREVLDEEPPIPGEEMIGERATNAPVMGLTHGGPGQEIVRYQKSTIGISTSMARMFGYQEGDVFLEVSGDSMAGAGIVDGSLVLMYDLMGLSPQRGRVALVQIVDKDDMYTSTLKFYMGRDDSTGLPKLQNGAGEPYKYKEGVKSATAIMVARMAMTQL